MQKIIDYLIEKRGYSFKGFRKEFIEDRITSRMKEKKLKKTDLYLKHLYSEKEELDEIIKELTIPVSGFFRNPAIFEIIFQYILPSQIVKKKSKGDRYFRFWSAGCSRGEEPYSLTIILKELFKHEKTDFIIESFATDIDKKALEFAEKAVYSYDSIKNSRFEWVKNYFEVENNLFRIKSEIKKAVHFSYHDLRNEKNIVPPESIFGYFDMVFCRNVLIYYDKKTQHQIIANLLKSMSPGGYLVLGETESVLPEYKESIKKKFNFCSIYQKK
ncbi:MAG: protein-glutamate O-methyltransferase CheR [Candidatus Caldatribacteriota bacterium]